MILYYFFSVNEVNYIIGKQGIFWLMLAIRKLQINAHFALCIIYELAAKKIGSKAQHFVLTLGKLVDLSLILAKLLVIFWY